VVVAGPAPLDEGVSGGAFERGRHDIPAAQHHGVALPDRQIGSAADKAGAALEDGDPRRLIRGPRLDVVNTGPEEPDAAARDIDLGAFLRTQMAQVEVDSPLSHADLHDTVAKIADAELGIRREIDRVGADANFGARLRVGREPPPGSDRIIDLGC